MNPLYERYVLGGMPLKGLEYGDKGRPVVILQELLQVHGHATPIDGDWGPATQAAYAAWLADEKLPHNFKVDAVAEQHLGFPFFRASEPPTQGPSPEAVVVAAKRHLAEHPKEMRGYTATPSQNMGPWVRLYMKGNEGRQWPWCAGFVSYVLRQAYLGQTPFAYTYSCDALASYAEKQGLFLDGKAALDVDPQRLVGSAFLVQKSTRDWTHTGIVIGCDGQTVTTVEGNTNDEGHREGYEVCRRHRRITSRLDFALLPL